MEKKKKKIKKKKKKKKKMEPGSQRIVQSPDLSVRTSVAKHSLRFNTSIMK